MFLWIMGFWIAWFKWLNLSITVLAFTKLKFSYLSAMQLFGRSDWPFFKDPHPSVETNPYGIRNTPQTSPAKVGIQTQGNAGVGAVGEFVEACYNCAIMCGQETSNFSIWETERLKPFPCSVRKWKVSHILSRWKSLKGIKISPKDCMSKDYNLWLVRWKVHLTKDVLDFGVILQQVQHL